MGRSGGAERNHPLPCHSERPWAVGPRSAQPPPKGERHLRLRCVANPCAPRARTPPLAPC